MSKLLNNNYLRVIFAAFLFSLSVNLFVVPSGIYNGGLFGFSQLLRTILVEYLHFFTDTNFDITGILNFCVNIPLFILAYFSISKNFLKRTFVYLIFQTIFLTLIPIPSKAIISDVFANTAISAIIGGYAIGNCLTFGGSSAGLDIVGVYGFKKRWRFTVGQIGIIFNMILFSIYAILFSLDITIYSILYSVIFSFVCDKSFHHSVKVQAFIVSKTKDLSQKLAIELNRGATVIKTNGAFTGEDSYMTICLVSKFEVSQLKRIVYEIDKNAFIMFNKNVEVTGYFKSKIDC